MNSDYNTDYLCHIHGQRNFLWPLFSYYSCLQYKTPTFVIPFSLWVVLHAMELHVLCISFYHIYFSKTRSVLVIAKITVVFQGVNELHVNVQNDINH